MEDFVKIMGLPVVDKEGQEIGVVDNVYFENDKPAYATVATGWTEGESTFFPLDDAEVKEDQVVVPYSADQLKDAPTTNPEAELSDEESQDVYGYYQSAKESADNEEDDNMLADNSGSYRLKRYVVTETVVSAVPVTDEDIQTDQGAVADDMDHQSEGTAVSDVDTDNDENRNDLNGDGLRG